MNKAPANLNALAHEIAYCTSRTDIECMAAPAGGSVKTGWWWRIDKCAKDDRQWVDRAVRYLDARGLLERHPKHPNRVRIANA